MSPVRRAVSILVSQKITLRNKATLTLVSDRRRRRMVVQRRCHLVAILRKVYVIGRRSGYERIFLSLIN